MKKLLLMKTVLLLFALVVGSGSVWADDTYVKVTETSQLTAGSEYLIVYENGNSSAACGAISTTSTKYGISVDVAVSSSTITISNQAVISFILGGSSNAWTFNFPSTNNYLTWSSGNSLNKKEITGNTTLSNNEKWTVSISNGTTTITNNATSGNTTRYLKYNSNSGQQRFACYTSGQQNVSLYKKQAAVVVTSLTIKYAPTKVRYEVGENLSMSGFVLDADGTEVSSGYTMTMGGSAITNGATLSSAGKKTITVSYGGKTVDQEISVGAVTGISVTTAPTKTSYDTGDSFDPTGMVVTASLSTGEAVSPDTWTKEVTGYTYSPDGALAPANTSVTITYSGQTTTQSITVTNVAVTGVSVKASTTIEKAKTETLTPTFTPSNATNKNVTWQSDDTSVAEVSAAGVVMGVAAGTANITVTTEDGGKTATCVVTVVNKKGSEDAPYSVADLEGQATATTFGNNIYVTGYIVGCVKDNKCYKTTTASLVNSNILISDTPDKSFTEAVNVSNIDGMIPVQLGTTALQNAWGIKSNNVIGYKVILKGNAESYFGLKGIKSTSEISAVSVPVTPGYNKITYVTPYKMDFSEVSGLKAYVATAANGSGVTMTKVEAAVPENTPLLLIGTKDVTYNVPVAASATAPATNYLVKGDGTTDMSGVAGYNYILYSDGLFYKVNSGTIATTKAYLHLENDPTAGGARGLDIVIDDDVTAIETVKTQKVDDQFYNLAGQRVAQPTKGLYIVNGRKVVVK